MFEAKPIVREHGYEYGVVKDKLYNKEIIRSVVIFCGADFF